MNFIRAYLVFGMATLAWCLCVYPPPLLTGWVHAIISSVLFVLFWPVFMIHGLVILWRHDDWR